MAKADLTDWLLVQFHDHCPATIVAVVEESIRHPVAHVHAEGDRHLSPADGDPICFTFEFSYRIPG